MLIANSIAWSVVFCMSSAIYMTLLGFLLRDVKPREDMLEGHSRALCTVNHILTGYAIFTGICMAVIIFFVNPEVRIPAGWLWAFLAFATIAGITMFIWALRNMDSIVGVILFIISMVLVYLLMHDLMAALKLGTLWRMLALCMLIATVGFGIARTLRDHGKYLMQESAGEKGHGRIVAATIIDIVTVVLLISTLLFGIIAPKQPNPGGGITDADIADVSNLSVAKVTEEDFAELELSTYPYSDKMFLSSLGVCDDTRVKEAGFSDAVTFPYESNNSEKMIVETEEEIFRNPIYGQMMAKGLKDKYPCGAKKTIGELNPWMDELLSKKWYEWCVKTTDPESKESTIKVAHEYRLLAATMCNLLHQFVLQGVQAHQTIENWRLNTPVGKDTDRDTMLAEYQYSKDALIFVYTPKNKAGSKDFKDLFVFGLNIHDKRIEFYGEEDEPETAKTPSSGSSGSSSGNSSGNNSSNPGGGSDTSSNPSSSKPTSPDNPNPSPTEPGNPYNKDPNKAPKTNTEKNDDPGPGPNTNNGLGSNISAADSQYNSGNSSMKENQNTQEEQKAKNQNSSNTPSTKSNGNVDNPGAGADLSTPVQDSGRTGGHALTDDEDGGDWGSPPD